MRAVVDGRPERAVPSLLKQAVVFPAALSAIVALVLVGEVRELASLSRWGQHTDAVIDAAHRVEQILIDRESGFRRLMNGPREEFLAPYTRTAGTLAAKFATPLRLDAASPPRQ